MIVACRWCGSDRTYGEACGACPCPLDVNEVILAKLARLESRAPRERRSVVSGILSARTAARKLGIGRDTLGRLVEAGLIETVSKGARRGFRARDVETLIEKGWKLDAPEKPAPQKPKRRRLSPGDAAASIVAELAKF